MVDDAMKRMSPVAALKRPLGLLVVGSAGAQALTLLGSVILVRLYTPEEFGRYSAALGVATLLGTIWMLRFEQGVFLTRNTEVRRDFLVLGTWIAVALTATWLVTMAIVDSCLRKISVEALFVIPLLALSMAVYEAATQWMVAQGHFKSIARRSLALSLTLGAAQSGLVWMNRGLGLSWGAVLGRTFVAFLIFRQIGALGWLRRVRPNLRLFKEYSDIPRHSVSGALLNKASVALLVPLMGWCHGHQVAGLFGVGLQMCSAPLAILTSSATQLVTASLVNTSSLREFRQAIKGTGVLLLGSALLTLFFGVGFPDEVVQLALGPHWSAAAAFIPPLSIAFAAMMLGSPLHGIWTTSGNLSRANVWSAMRAMLVFGLFLIGSKQHLSPITLTWTWSIATVFLYAISTVDCLCLLRISASRK